MRRRAVTRSLALAAALVSAVGIGATVPASATPAAPTVTNVDAPSPGHVTGTVTSAEPYVFVRTETNAPATMLTLVGGTADFDLETWGYIPGGTRSLQVTACTSANPQLASDCSPQADTGTSFVPADVVPTITWPDDVTVGPGEHPNVTVSDPSGGGVVRATWAPNVGQDAATDLDRNGTTPLNLSDGTGTVTLKRCSLVIANRCTTFTPTQQWTGVSVHESITSLMETVDPVTSVHPTTTAVVDTSRAGTYTLAWHVEKNGTPVNGVGASGIAGTLDGNGRTAAFNVSLPGLADGFYELVADVTVTEPGYGTYAVTSSSNTVLVSRSAPSVTSVTRSHPTLYPRVNNAAHPGSTSIVVHGALDYDESIEIRNALGTVVAHRALTFLDDTRAESDWDGRDDGGLRLVPAGTYRVFVVDGYRNAAAATTTIVVSWKQLVLRTTRITVSARGSMVFQKVGRCSTLRKPSLRKWVGSLGYYANTRCTSTTATASTVISGHAVRLPAAESYRDIQVNLYGGAAKARPRSRGVIQYLTTSANVTAVRAVSPTLGTHAGIRKSAAGLVFPDRSFGWYFGAASGNRYDVRNFTVIVRYYVVA